MTFSNFSRKGELQSNMAFSLGLGFGAEDGYYNYASNNDNHLARWLLRDFLARSVKQSNISQSLDACEDEEIPEITCDLSQQLSSHFNNPQFSDVTLRVKTKVYHVHKLILCAWSEVFSEILSVGSKKGKTAKCVATCKVESDGIHTVLIVKEKDECAKVFEDFLKFMYTESVDLSDTTVYPIFQLAKTYKVNDLSDLCQEFLIQKVSDDTGAARYLGKAESLGMTQLYEHCIDVFERNFGFIPESCLTEMSPQLFLRVIGSSKLVVSTELYVLTKAVKWLLADGKEERRKHTEKILSLIRLAHILPAQLKRASFHILNSSKMYPKFKNIYKKLLHEAFEWHAISPNDVFSELPYHLQFSSFSRNFVPLRYYIGEQTENYFELLLKVQSDEEMSSDDSGYIPGRHPHLPFVLMSVTQNNVCVVHLYKEAQWELDGVTFFDQEAKLWGVRYHLKPSSRDCEMKHAEKSFHAAILTAPHKSGGSSKPIVSTFEGVTAKFGDEQEITVTLSPQLLRQKRKPTAVDVRVVFFLKLKHSELTNLKLRKPEEIPRRLPGLRALRNYVLH